MSVIYAILYYFRQATKFLSKRRGATYAGNLDPSYLFAPSYIIENRKNKKMWISIAVIFGAMAVYFALQILVNKDVDKVKGLITIFKILICTVVLMYGIKYYNRVRLKQIAYAITYMNVISLVFALIFRNCFLWRTHDYINKYTTTRLQLFYLEPSELGFHLVLIMIILLHYFFQEKNRREKLKLIIMFALNGIVLFFARSMGAICIGAVTFAVMFIVDWIRNHDSKKKNIINIVIICCVLAAIGLMFITKSDIANRIIDTINGKDASNGYRIGVSFDVLKASLKDTKFMGVGFGNLNTPKFRAKYSYLGLYEVLANSFMYFVIETGIFGIIVLAAILVLLIKACVKKKDTLRIGMVAFLVTYQLLASHFTNGVIWLIYGLILSEAVYEKKRHTDDETVYNSDKKINLLYLHAGAELYGADNVMYELIRGLDKDKYNIDVVLPCDGPLVNRIGGIDKVNVEVMPYPILRRKYFNLKGMVSYAFNYIRYSFKLIHYVKKHKIDVVHVNTTAVLEGIMIKAFCEAKIVWHVHEIIVKPRKVAKLIYYCVNKWSDEIVTVSNAVCEAVKTTNESVNVIYNGVDNNKFNDKTADLDAKRKELGITGDNIIVGMVGRVNAWKGQNDFVDALKPVLEKHDNVTALMIGGVFEGEEWRMTELKKKISELHLENRIVVSDFRNDINEIYKLMDIFVLPSTNPDPLPTVVLEAMANGLPVVGYEHGGVCEMVKKDYNGLLVQVCNPSAMAEAIEKLITDTGLRKEFGRHSVERQHSMFSLTAYINNFDRLYTKTMGEIQ